MKHIYQSIQIDRRSNLAYDIQIANQIRNKIMLHKFDKSLLNPKNLMALLDIDEKTIIKGLDRLVQSEVLAYDQNSDRYFVNYKEYTVIKGNKAISYLDLMRNLKQRPKIKTINCEEVICDQKLSNQTLLETGTKLYKQLRLYYGDDYPRYYTKTYFTKKFIEQNNISIDDLAHQSYVQLLNEHHMAYQTKRMIKSIYLPDDVNKLLNQPMKTAGLSSRETHYDQDGNIIIFSFVYMNMNYALKVI